MSQAGTFVASLKHYNLPDFILAMVAKECRSDLLERGRIDDRLQSMNDDALEMLHAVFVDCKDDGSGRFAQYRFYAYISSMYHKNEILINESVPGISGKNHRVMVAVKSSGMYVAVATNKATGNMVNRRDLTRFYNTVDDIKQGDHGTMLIDAIYGSSVGFRDDAAQELSNLSKTRAEKYKDVIDFKLANFENNIYSVTKC